MLYCVFLNLLTYIYNLKLKMMNRIKEVLKEKGVKQVWLAEQLGKSFNTVNGYVQNRAQPSLPVLFEIGKILKVEPKDLLIKTENE